MERTLAYLDMNSSIFAMPISLTVTTTPEQTRTSFLVSCVVAVEPSGQCPAIKSESVLSYFRKLMSTRRSLT